MQTQPKAVLKPNWTNKDQYSTGGSVQWSGENVHFGHPSGGDTQMTMLQYTATSA